MPDVLVLGEVENIQLKVFDELAIELKEIFVAWVNVNMSIFFTGLLAGVFYIVNS